MKQWGSGSPNPIPSVPPVAATKAATPQRAAFHALLIVGQDRLDAFRHRAVAAFPAPERLACVAVAMPGRQPFQGVILLFQWTVVPARNWFSVTALRIWLEGFR